MQQLGRRAWDRREHGVALIAVLWVLTLLSIVVALLSLETRSDARVARNTVDNAAVRAAADAGVQRAILDLVSFPKATDTRQFRADGTVYSWRFARCLVRLSVQDERGKIDLNQAPEALLAGLIESVGVDRERAQALADAIADFRDADNLRRLNGAEEADYRAAGVAWGPKNAPFQSIEELQQVLGMTSEVYKRTAPYLTVYSLGIVNPALADAHLNGIIKQASFNSLILSNSPGLVFSIRAEAKDSRESTFIRESVVQLDPAQTVPVHVLDWRQGESKNPR
jgi:general secretion pathway protein K